MTAIVPFTPHHTEKVIGLILPIQQIEFGLAISLADQSDLLDIAAVYQRGTGNFWVALDGDDVVGTLAMLDIGNRQGAVRKMFVHASRRGATRGVARSLLETLTAWCVDRDVRELYLGTTAPMHAAHHFYARNGFDEIAPSELPERFPVMAVDTKFYRRTVTRTDLPGYR